MSEKLQDIAAGRTEPKAKGFGGWIAGRASRRSYWLWIGPTFVAMLVTGAIGLQLVAFPLALLITMIWIRRLHDLGRSGWWAAVINIAVNVGSWAASYLLGADIGSVVALVFLLLPIVSLGAIPGQPTRNEFGPPPGKADVVEAFS